MRKVTTMFVCIKLAEAPCATLQEFSAYLQREFVAWQRALRRYGGTLGRLQIDDKGIVMKAIFGLPGATHENDSVRAVLSGVAIRDGCRGRGVTVRS